MQPLDHIRVVDLTHVLAGPFATHQLRMMGADVIKIERPGTGDAMRGLALRPDLGGLTPGFIALNCGKRSLAVDITTAEGREIVLKLAATADVFVENFRPGKAAKLGLDVASVRATNPRIVYCSISGWGQQGPYAKRPAYDHVVQAATGMMMLQGDDDEAPPVKVGFPVIDIATGMAASQAILAALLRRQRGDQSPIVLDVSMTDASLTLMCGMAAQVWLGGQAPGRVGNRGFVGSPGADTFPTADGWISTGANTLGQFEALCAVIGRPELARDPRYLPARPASPAGFLTDQGNEALREELVAAFRQGRAQELEERLNAVGVPASAVRTLAEFMHGPYTTTGGISAALPSHPLRPGAPAQVLSEGFRWVGEPAREAAMPPRLGEHGAVILGELGLGPERVAALVEKGVVGSPR